MEIKSETTFEIPYSPIGEPKPFIIPKPFRHPVSICIAGTTGAGKTTWIYKFLKYKDAMFENEVPENVLYCYDIYQDLYDKMSNEFNFITFHAGLPSKETLLALPSSSIVILDDLCHKIVNNTDIELLFSQLSHHKKITVCFMKNNIFYQGKNARTISLNTNVLILMKNPSDTVQVEHLARRLYGKNSSILIDAYNFAVNKLNNRGYLIIDMSPCPTTDITLKTGIFPNELLILFKQNKEE